MDQTKQCFTSGGLSTFLASTFKPCGVFEPVNHLETD